MPRLRPAPEPQPPAKPPELFESKEPEPLVESEVDIEAKPPEQEKPEPVKEPEKPKQSEAELALLKQIETLRQNEQMQRKRFEEMQRVAQEREAQVVQSQQRVEEQEELVVGNALAAAQARANKAQQDMETAITNGDAKAQATAYRELAKAENDISIYERGQQEIEVRKKAPKEEPKPPPQREQRRWNSVAEFIDEQNYKPETKEWLKAHQEVLGNHPGTNVRAMKHLEYLIAVGVEKGMQIESAEFRDFADAEMGYKPKPEPEPTTQRAAAMSAPVSREVPSATGTKASSTRVTLTADEKEMARLSGITDTEYAKQKLKLQAEKANGQYGERR